MRHHPQQYATDHGVGEGEGVLGFSEVAAVGLRHNRAPGLRDENWPEDGARFPKVEGAAGSVNALDWYGFWKLGDALCDAAFDGKNREYALGDTPEQRFMGAWSDGTPAKELVVTKEPPAAAGP